MSQSVGEGAKIRPNDADAANLSQCRTCHEKLMLSASLIVETKRFLGFYEHREVDPASRFDRTRDASASRSGTNLLGRLFGQHSLESVQFHDRVNETTLHTQLAIQCQFWRALPFH